MSEYKKSHCKDAVSLMQQGFGVASLCKVFQCTKDELKSWVNQHDDFAHAISWGLTCLEAFWEERAVDIALGGGKLAHETVFRKIEQIDKDAAFFKQDFSDDPDEFAFELGRMINATLICREDYDPERDSAVVKRIEEITSRGQK